jgi:hypothetical protein
MSEISTRLLEAHRGKACLERYEAIYRAWAAWRAAIVRAMAARLEQSDDDGYADDEIEALQSEMNHCQAVFEVLADMESPVQD